MKSILILFFLSLFFVLLVVVWAPLAKRGLWPYDVAPTAFELRRDVRFAERKALKRTGFLAAILPVVVAALQFLLP